MKILENKIFFISFCLLIFILLNSAFFYNLLHLPFIPIDLLNQTIYVYKNFPETWQLLKNIYNVFFIFSSLILLNYFYTYLRPYLTTSDSPNLSTSSSESYESLQLFLGTDENGKKVFIPEKGLYQNILITGSIGSR